MTVKELNRPPVVYRLFVTNKEVRNLNLFFTGFIIYTLSNTVAVLPEINRSFCQGFQLVGLALFIPATFGLAGFRFESRYFKVIYLLYLFWLATVVMRGLTTDYGMLKQMLFESEVGIFVYLVPLIILFPQNALFYKRLFDAIFLLNIFYILYVLFFINQILGAGASYASSRQIIEGFSKNLSLPGAFILLTYLYHAKKKRLLAFGVIILLVLLAVIKARRALIFMGISSLATAALIYCSIAKAKAFPVTFAIILLVALAALSFIGMDAWQADIFGTLTERAKDDSRTGVELCFFSEMSPLDWIIGKGMNGQYYCPAIDAVDVNYRGLIETGYLNIILKGGLISLLLFSMILFPAIFKGFFRSKNILSKAAASWILLWVLYSHPSTVATVTLNYMLIWISVGICYSRKLRNMSDTDLKILLSFIEKNKII